MPRGDPSGYRLSELRADELLEGLQSERDLRRVACARLGLDLAPAAAAAARLADLLGEVAGLEPLGLDQIFPDADDERRLLAAAGEDAGRDLLLLDQAVHHLAEIVDRRVGHMIRRDLLAADVAQRDLARGRGGRRARLRLQLRHLLEPLLDLLGDVLPRALEELRELVERLFLAAGELDDLRARDRLDAPDAAADRGLARDAERADRRRMLEMGAAAELDRQARPHGHDPDSVAVLL